MKRTVCLGLVVALASLAAACAPEVPSTYVGAFANLKTVPDDAAVRRLARQQADAGDTKAMVDYAHLQTNERVTYEESLRRQAEAERFDRQAAERGDPVGQTNTGVWCMINQRQQTLPGACKSDVEAVRWFRLAMDQGNADGMACYAYMVELGRGGVAKDPALAASYYADAGKRGSGYARAFLNDMTEFADRAPRGPNP
jgi:TPR repeat protein